MDPNSLRTDEIHQKKPVAVQFVPNGERLVRAFTEWRDELISTLWYILGNKEDAQDVAQETFLKCWKKKEDVSKVENLKAWIFRVALNAGKDLQRSAYKRKSRAMPAEEIMESKEIASPCDLLENQESVELIRKALMDLRPEEKEVFLLRQNAEMSYEDIAKNYNRPLGTVKTQMRTALQKLKKALA